MAAELVRREVEWDKIVERRKETMVNFRASIMEVFNLYHAKIAGTERNSPDSPMPAFPTIKTPARPGRKPHVTKSPPPVSPKSTPAYKNIGPGKEHESPPPPPSPKTSKDIESVTPLVTRTKPSKHTAKSPAKIISPSPVARSMPSPPPQVADTPSPMQTAPVANTTSPSPNGPSPTHDVPSPPAAAAKSTAPLPKSKAPLASTASELEQQEQHGVTVVKTSRVRLLRQRKRALPSPSSSDGAPAECQPLHVQQQLLPAPKRAPLIKHVPSSQRTPLRQLPSSRQTPVKQAQTPSKQVNTPAKQVQTTLPTGHQTPLQLLQEEHRKRTGSGHVVSLQELTMNSSEKTENNIPVKRVKLDANKPSQLLGGKRLRSVSLERVSLVSKIPRQSEDDCYICDDTDTPDTPLHTAKNDLVDSSGEPADGSTKTGNFFVKPNKPVSVAASSEVKSFLPTKIPEVKKPDPSMQKAKLQRKVEEEARRKEELEEKKRQELLQKKLRREERARKVAENQAALKMQREKRKLNKNEQSAHMEQIKLKKAKVVEEKNRKLKERMAAAEARRKQDEEQQKKRLQQMEEDKRMAADLAIKRKELEEEEKRQRRLEKQRLERERQLQHEAEQKAKEAELKKKLEEENALKKAADRRMGKGVPHVNQNPAAQKHDEAELQRHFERLLAGNKSSRQLPSLESTQDCSPTANPTNSGSGPGPRKRFMQNFYGAMSGKKPAGLANTTATATPPPHVMPPSPLTTATLNTTFTVPPVPAGDVPSAPPVMATPAAGPSSNGYQMTPADVLMEVDNYCIDDLNSGDSTDDEENPRKDIPAWAQPEELERALIWQTEALNRKELRIGQIFPQEQLFQMCDLNKIFKFKRKRFIKRSSSAMWSPFVNTDSPA